MDTFNSSTYKAEAGESLEFKARLVYKLSFRPARATMGPYLKEKVAHQKTSVRFSGMDIDGLGVKIPKGRMLLEAVCTCVMIQN